MKVFRRKGSHRFCGFWNGSPLEVGLTKLLTRVPEGEVPHHHDYHEYYLVLRGRGELLIGSRPVPLEAQTLVMVEPGERHKVSWVDPDLGIQWVIIKERSEPDSRVIPEDAGNV